MKGFIISSAADSMLDASRLEAIESQEDGSALVLSELPDAAMTNENLNTKCVRQVAARSVEIRMYVPILVSHRSNLTWWLQPSRATT